MRSLNNTEQQELRRELYYIYTEQLSIWFELLPADKQQQIIIESQERERQIMLEQIMKSPHLVWS